jgi:2-hydroxychromene-2-carboxylate isomerase
LLGLAPSGLACQSFSLRGRQVSEPILFHFDYLSPYAYLAWKTIHAVADRHQRQVVAVPTLFAALLANGGTKGPAEIPAKRIYVFKDAMRTARVLGLPFGAPPTHPFNPLLALRMASIVPEPDRSRLVHALFDATWGGGTGIDTEHKVVALANGVGLDGDALARRAAEADAKALLKQQTDEAIAAGVFGVPTMRVDDELFWGFDSFGHLERHLAGEDSIQPDEIYKWAHVVPSAMRRGL